MPIFLKVNARAWRKLSVWMNTGCFSADEWDKILFDHHNKYHIIEFPSKRIISFETWYAMWTLAFAAKQYLIGFVAVFCACNSEKFAAKGEHRRDDIADGIRKAGYFFILIISHIWCCILLFHLWTCDQGPSVAEHKTNMQYFLA